MIAERETIIRENPLQPFLESRGHTFTKRGKDMVTKCPLHDDKDPSLRVAGNVWFCDPCATGGSIIDLVAKLDGITPVAAMQKLSGDITETMEKQNPKPILKPVNQQAKITAVYRYENASSETVYEVVRYEPKDFRQRRPDGSGGFIGNMDGVTRVLYNLPGILQSETVWIVEGEKDADTLKRLGRCGTCNVGGAGKWMQGYTDALEGKDVIICPDNDDAGRKHATIVRESLAGKVKTLRVITIPKDFKDVSDYVAFCKNDDEAREQLLSLAISAPVFKKGLDLPILDASELSKNYENFVKAADVRSLDLGKWIPSLRKFVRPLVPGEMVTIIADTGVGKTALLQNLSLAASPLPVLFFEMELPDTLMFERYISMTSKHTGESVFKSFALRDRTFDLKPLSHIYVCPLSDLNPEKIQELIVKSELKIGQPPAVVVVDYIGLVSGKGKDRYQRLSDVAEAMKRIAKATNTVFLIASQMHRKEGSEVNLHDAKDSGSIENSSGLVLGAWREETNPDILNLKILKSTKGGGGNIVKCNFNGPTMIVTEMVEERRNVK